MSKYEIKEIVEEICGVLVTLVIIAGVLVAGWMIGSANAHSTRVHHEYQLSCIDQGGTLVEMDDEKVCIKK